MKNCKICNVGIEEKAKKCPHCGSHQSWFKRWVVVGKYILETLTFVTAVIVVIIMYIQIKQVNKQLEYQWDEFTQKYEPNIIIQSLGTTDMKLVDTSLTVFINIQNTGVKDAEKVVVRYHCRYGEKFERGETDSVSHEKVSSGIPAVNIFTLAPIDREIVLLEVNVSYNWKYYSETLSDTKHFVLFFNEEYNRYQCRVISEKDFNKLPSIISDTTSN